MALGKNANGAVLHALFKEIFMLQSVLAERMDIIHTRAGLATPQVRTLDTLSHAGAATVPDIAARLGVSRQFIQTTCNELEGRGLLSFRDNPRHKRSRLVEITPDGSALLARFRTAEAKLLHEKLPDIDAEAVTVAQGLLSELRHRIENVAVEDL